MADGACVVVAVGVEVSVAVFAGAAATLGVGDASDTAGVACTTEGTTSADLEAGAVSATGVAFALDVATEEIVEGVVVALVLAAATA